VPVGVPPWQTAAPMPERRSYFAAAQLAGEVYVAGGMVGASGRYVLRLQRFDPQRDSWTRLPDLPAEARAAAGAALGGTLYVVGGPGPARGPPDRLGASRRAGRRWLPRP